MRDRRIQWAHLIQFLIKFLIIALVVAIALFLMGKIPELNQAIAVIQKGGSWYTTILSLIIFL